MARLSKEQFSDKSRYQLREKEVRLPELGGGEVLVRSLRVSERDKLAPHFLGRDSDGQPTAHDKAIVLAAIVADPQLTTEEAQEFVDELPAAAFDRIIGAYWSLSADRRSDEEAAEVAKEFPGPS